MPTDLQIAVSALTAKKPRYDMLWRYYDSEHPLVYSSAKLKEIFHGLDARFVENWCAVVVDSVLDRMELRELAVADDEEASAAIAGTNGQELDGRQLRVNEAMDKPRRDRDAGYRW